MADTVYAETVSVQGARFHTDECVINSITAHVPFTKLAFGALDTATIVSTSDGLPVSVIGTAAVTQSGTWNITNISGTISLPTGAATAAKQPALGTAGTASSDVITIQGIASMTPLQIGDNSGSLTVDAPVGTPVFVRLSDGASAITTLPVSLASVPSHAVTNAGTFAVQVDGNALTALQLIDDVVFADDAAFTLASSKVAMVGAIRDDSLSTLTAVEGDAVPLRVSSTGALHVTGAGGGTQYNVDTVAGGSDTGTLLLAIRDDSLSTLTPADGDYVGLRVSSTGALHVTGGGGGTEYNEDVATPATITGTATMMERDDALSTLTPIEGDWAAMRCSANGALWVAVDGTVAATQSGTWNITNISGTVSLPTGASTLAEQQTQTTALQLIDDGIATVASAITTKGMAAVGTDGTNARILKTDTSGELQVDVLTLPNVTLAAGTNTNEVVGDAAHGAAVAGNPILNGLEGRSTEPTAVDDGDVVRALATLLGKQVLLPYALPAKSWSYAAASGGITNTTGVTCKTAAGAGVRNYVARVSVVNGHASTSTEVIIRDGAAGTVLWRGWAQAAGGGCSAVFDPPLRGTANTLVQIENVTTGAATYFNLQGYEAAE